MGIDFLLHGVENYRCYCRRGANVVRSEPQAFRLERGAMRPKTGRSLLSGHAFHTCDNSFRYTLVVLSAETKAKSLRRQCKSVISPLTLTGR